MEMEDSDRNSAILPDELMVEIFRRLEQRDQNASSLVCKRWLSLVGQTIEAICFYLPEKSITLYRLNVLSRRFANVRDMSIFEFEEQDGNPNAFDFLSDSGLAAIGDGFTKLESLSLDTCPHVTSEGLISIAMKCKRLKSLDLRECYIGVKGASAIGKYCTRLENLCLLECNSLTDSALIALARGCGRTLKSLRLGRTSLTDFSIKDVGLHCVNLETLSLSSEFINDEGLLSIAKGCPLLKSLVLHHINVTHKSLCAIGEGCKKLKDLSFCDCDSLNEFGLDSIAVCFPELERLEIYGCNNIGRGVQILIRKARFRLSELEIKVKRFQHLENNGSAEFAAGWNRLQSLCLMGVEDEMLRFLTTACTNLKKLDLRSCYEVGDEGIISVAQNCKFLTNLDLGYCRRVGDAGIIAIAGGCHQLSYLNVEGAEALGDEGLAALGDGCRLLRKLNISFCRRITDVGLCCIARNCKLLESCKMATCPYITKVGVRILITGCWKLKRLDVGHWAISSRMLRRVRGHIKVMISGM